MKDILSPEEKKRFEKNGFALVKPNTPWPLRNLKIARKYKGCQALITHEKRSEKTKTGFPNETLVVIGKRCVKNVLSQMFDLAKEKLPQPQNKYLSLIFDMIDDPDKISLGFITL